jgi:uncharacterized protein
MGAFLLCTYIVTAMPEEIFPRGWMQNLITRRIGRTTSLIGTAILFGLPGKAVI